MTQEQKIIDGFAYVRGTLDSLWGVAPKEPDGFSEMMENLREEFGCLQEDVYKAMGIETGVMMP